MQTPAVSDEGTGVYIAECFSCGDSYNASEAVWCNCLSSTRSLVCPRCLKCFCAAPKSYKEKFWDSAPQELWSRLVVEHDRNAAEEPNPAPDETRRPLVLIVEPDKQIRRMARRLVEGFGYAAVVADDGMAGLGMALQYAPDLVLTAALMPRMDGREMCRRIKKSSTTAKAKVAVMTELYTQKKYKAEAFNNFHVDEYVSKPVAMRTLQSILQKYLD